MSGDGSACLAALSRVLLIFNSVLRIRFLRVSEGHALVVVSSGGRFQRRLRMRRPEEHDRERARGACVCFEGACGWCMRTVRTRWLPSVTVLRQSPMPPPRGMRPYDASATSVRRDVASRGDGGSSRAFTDAGTMQRRKWSQEGRCRATCPTIGRLRAACRGRVSLASRPHRRLLPPAQ